MVEPGGRRAGYRLATNRDELRRRAAARPPEPRRFGGRDALMPVDATAGGTWVAANDAGLAFSLLNRNPTDMRGKAFPGRASRGTIIPALLEAVSLDEAEARIRALDAKAYAPFRLVATDGDTCIEAVGEGEVLTVMGTAVDGPLMFTSSGLGDALVEPPRRELFRGWFGDEPSEWPARQDTFHRHRWPERPELSVCMAREDARSVSLTVVAVDAGQVVMTYHGAPPDEPAVDVRLVLPVRASA